ncbi:hypothetical protein GGI06_004241, partial [Coemansia sp. S85]
MGSGYLAAAYLGHAQSFADTLASEQRHRAKVIANATAAASQPAREEFPCLPPAPAPTAPLVPVAPRAPGAAPAVQSAKRPAPGPTGLMVKSAIQKTDLRTTPAPRKGPNAAQLARNFDELPAMSTPVAYLRFPSAGMQHADAITQHCTEVLTQFNVRPLLRNASPIHAFCLTKVHAIGVSFASSAILNLMVAHPPTINGTVVPWSGESGVIHPVFICGVPLAAAEYVLRAALKDVSNGSSNLRQEYMCGYLTGDWSGLLYLPEGQPLPKSCKFRHHKEPARIIPAHLAIPCITCKRRNSEHCFCAAPHCHAANLEERTKAQALAALAAIAENSARISADSASPGNPAPTPEGENSGTDSTETAPIPPLSQEPLPASGLAPDSEITALELPAAGIVVHNAADDAAPPHAEAMEMSDGNASPAEDMQDSDDDCDDASFTEETTIDDCGSRCITVVPTKKTGPKAPPKNGGVQKSAKAVKDLYAVVGSGRGTRSAAKKSALAAGISAAGGAPSAINSADAGRADGAG